MSPKDDAREPVEDAEPELKKEEQTGRNNLTDAVDVDDEEVGDATWNEVFTACCVHSGAEWASILMGIFIILFFLYFFLLGLELLGTGAKVMSGCKAGELFGSDTNPLAGLFIGILATVLLQSSSTTTSIVVTLVGADAISVRDGVYMIMGSNIGTSVTNTLVSMGQMGDNNQLERAFAGATVHDMFNFMTVAILFPLEIITGYLKRLTKAMVKNAQPKEGEEWEGPLDKIVAPLGDRIIRNNSSLTRGIAQGTASCAARYPLQCDPAVDPPTYESCGGSSSKFGLITCSSDGFCPAFFNPNATESDDFLSGVVVFIIAIIMLFICLVGLVYMLQKMLLGMSTRIIYKATDMNGYVAMAVGAGLTVLVQSSSITTSTLTPLVGMGAIRLEQMFPLTLGANIGTTVTGIMSALVSDNIAALQVALAHLMFNVTGIIIFYPIPYMRNFPLHAARQLGKATRVWRGFPAVYIVVLFILVPLLFLGISALFEEKTTAFNVLGTFIVLLLSAALAYTAYWATKLNGYEKINQCMVDRERKRVALQDLPDDIAFLKAEIAMLKEHTGLLAGNTKSDGTEDVDEA